MKQLTNINADKILRVKMRPCRQSTSYYWEDAQPKKKWLFFVTQKATLAGWYNHYGELVTEESILEKHDHFKCENVLHRNSIWEKAVVTVESLGGKYTNNDYVYFNCDLAAEDYMKELGKLFPHIQIEY
jgi:hypothetical protein